MAMIFAPSESVGVPNPCTAWIDWLRLFAAYAVVILHASVSFIQLEDPSGIQWIGAEIIDTLTRWAVPCFVMITGALLLNGRVEVSAGSFYRKKLGRIVVPLVFWSLFFIVVNSLLEYHAGLPVRPRRLLMNFISGRPCAHLWYMFMLTGLYLAIPFFRKLFEKGSVLQQASSVFLFLCFSLAIPFLSSLNYETGEFWPIWFVQFAAYLLLGGIFFKKRTWRKTNASILLICIVLSSAAIAFLCRYRTLSVSLESGLYFFNFTSHFVIIMALSVFLAAGRCEKFLSLFPVPVPLQKASLGIYLIHPFFLTLVEYSHLVPDMFSVTAIFLKGTVCFGLSILSVLIMLRIPVARRLV